MDHHTKKSIFEKKVAKFHYVNIDFRESALLTPLGPPLANENPPSRGAAFPLVVVRGSGVGWPVIITSWELEGHIG